jgi:hypothetical protein
VQVSDEHGAHVQEVAAGVKDYYTRHPVTSLDTEAVLGGGYSPYATANGSTGDLQAQLADLAAEVERQDRFHPSGYPATRDGVFLGIKTAAHELDREAVDAWSGDRCKCATPLCGHADWQNTRGELLQVAAVIMRTIRSIDAHQPTPRHA